MLSRVFRIACKASLLAGAVWLALVGPALADRSFNARFSTKASGDIAIVGNTLETCQTSAPDCTNARAGKGSTLNNNSFAMERVDVDHTGLDSSSARLSLPNGARVLFAGLYYGARTTAGTRGKAASDDSPSALRTVDLKPAATSSFERLTGELDQSTEVKGAYGVFVDVTKQVRRDGSGVYTVARVQSATGDDRYAGWALVVAYEAAGDPPRDLTVFDGLQSVTQGKPALTIPVSGFQTPPSGAVRTKLGFVAYEGDAGLTGDSAALDGRPLSDFVTPANNFFNSNISVDGQHFTAKTPDYANQLGFDAKLTRIDGVLGNGATRASIALKTSSDQYLPQVISFATDLYAPVIHATKTVANLTHPNGPARPGDRLRYTVTYTNEGLEAAHDFIGSDVLPPGTTYLPDSLRIVGQPESAQPTDVQGDDLGEYDGASRAVRFFLGSAAAANRGGELAIAGQPGDRAEISFEARVDPVANEHEITDVAQATFVAPTLGKPLSAVSSPATIRVMPGEMSQMPADLAVAESETVTPGGAAGTDVVDDHITIENHGPGDASNVQLHDVVPPGAIAQSATVDQGSCLVIATEVNCRVNHLDAGGSAGVNVLESEPAAEARAGSDNNASVTADQFDSNPSNNSRDMTGAAAPASAGGPADVGDVSVQAHESPREVPLGGTLSEVITVVNHGPGAATGLDITDVLGAATQLVNANPGRATCSSEAPLHCTLATLAEGASETIRLTLRPLRAGQLIDAVDVSGDQIDSNYANNVAKATATVVRRTTVGRVRVVAVTPFAHAGQLVRFVVTAAVAKPTPALAPLLCVTVPGGLRLTAAPGAIRAGRLVCWHLGELIPGKPQSFELSAKVIRTSTLRATLSGSNFAARRSAAAVSLLVPPVVACPSRMAPRARIAC